MPYPRYERPVLRYKVGVLYLFWAKTFLNAGGSSTIATEQLANSNHSIVGIPFGLLQNYSLARP